MKYIPLLRLATAFVVITVSSHANIISEEIIGVKTTGSSYPTANAANFNGGAYDVLRDTTNNPDDIGDGSWGSGITRNFNPNNANTVVEFGEQRDNGNSNNPKLTTYFGPQFYAGINRDGYDATAGVIYANANGYRIRFNSISETDIGTAAVAAQGVEGTDGYVPAQAATGNGGNDINAKAIFVFDAGAQVGVPATGNPGDTGYVAEDTPNYLPAITLAQGDSWEFRERDTLFAQLAVPANMGNNGTGQQNRASLATYRPVVKANGEYYAGTLHTVDLNSFATDGGGNSARVFNITVYPASSNWTKMVDIVSTNNQLQNTTSHPQNLTVDVSLTDENAVGDTTSLPGITKLSTVGAETVSGSTLTNIEQVGFLLEASGRLHTGGINYGVREFRANATRVSAPKAGTGVVSWSEDFDTAVTLNIDSTNLSWGDWHIGANGVSGYQYEGGGDTTYYAPNSSVTLDQTLDSVLLKTEKVVEPADYTGTSNWKPGNEGAVSISGVGYGASADTTLYDPRLTKPIDYEATFVFDLVDFRYGQADLTLRSRGPDGFVTLQISPSGKVKFSHYWVNYTHTNFDDFNGPSKFRKTSNAENVSNGIVVTDGGTFNPASDVPVTVSISAPALATADGGVTALATANMNEAKDQVGEVGEDGYQPAVPANSYVESVTITEVGFGYSDEPTVTFSGGGMTVSPVITFNFETGNSALLAPGVLGGKDGDSPSSSNVIEAYIQSPYTFDDGQIFTIVQSYDSADDTLTYYYGFDNGPIDNVLFVADPALHSARAYGFRNVIGGNNFTTPVNDSAVFISYQQWGDHSESTTVAPRYATIGFNSYALEIGTDIDADSDGYLDRLDALPNNPSEWLDSDSDGVGNNSDEHNGFNDGVINAALDTTTADSTINLSAWLQAGNYVVDDGGPSLVDHNVVVGDLATANANLTAAEAERDTALADLTAKQTELDNAKEARPGSIAIDVTDAVIDGVTTQVANITLTVEETDAVSDWSNPTTSDHTIQLDAPASASFYRFTIDDE